MDAKVPRKPVQEFALEPDRELRFEVETNNKVSLEVMSGTAEIFGAEVEEGKVYVFPSGAKIALFTWTGCTVELRGKTRVSYISEETLMILYLNCHAALEELRLKAESENAKGPVLMVVGPSDVGKSTLCRILLNYAARMGRKPIFVDLDVGLGQISIPGSMGALLVERPAIVEEEFSEQSPLVYHFGYKIPNENLTLFDSYVKRISDVISDHMQSNLEVNVSGVVINTCGHVRNNAYKSLTNIAQAFEVDVIVVLALEKLYKDLNKDLPKVIKVVFFPESSGIVRRPMKMRVEARNERLKEYFYRLRAPPLPHSFDVGYTDVKIYRIVASPLLGECKPPKLEMKNNWAKFVAVQPGPKLLNRVLAVSSLTKLEEDVIHSNVEGFICVAKVDPKRKMLTLVYPVSQSLPQTILILSELQFMDSH